MQSAQIGANPILRLGDSISEEMYIGLPTNPETMGGHNARVLNAGFMGASSDDLIPYRNYTLSLLNPWCVLFQIGSNDAIAASAFDLPSWEAGFEAHINAITSHPGVIKTIVKTIPPVLNSTCGYDQDRINAMNQSIANVCARNAGATLLDLDPFLKCASTGYAKEGALLDSVHLHGAAAWTVAWLEYCLVNNQPLPAPPPAC